MFFFFHKNYTCTYTYAFLLKRRGRAFLAEEAACTKVPIGAFREQKRNPCDRRAGARGGDLGYGVRERAGPDVAGPCAPSKGV